MNTTLGINWNKDQNVNWSLNIDWTVIFGEKKSGKGFMESVTSLLAKYLDELKLYQIKTQILSYPLFLCVLWNMQQTFNYWSM